MEMLTNADAADMQSQHERQNLFDLEIKFFLKNKKAKKQNNESHKYSAAACITTVPVLAGILVLTFFQASYSASSSTNSTRIQLGHGKLMQLWMESSSVFPHPAAGKNEHSERRQ